MAAGTEDRFREAVLGLLPDYAVMVIAGTKAAGLSDGLVPFMVRRAKEAGLRVILDVRGPDLANSLRFHPDIIKPNLFEFAATFAPELIRNNNLIDDGEAVKRRVRELCRDLCADRRSGIVLTRGAQPVWFAQGEDFAEFPFETVKPVNTTGSGDAFTAGLTAALGDGASMEEAVAEGVRCGRLNAGFLKVGTILPS